jgi:hypothetical protein
VAVAIIAIAAVITLAFVDDVGTEIGTIATGAFGVVGTIVGAFFGIKVGTQAGESGKEDAQRTATTARAGEAERSPARRSSPPTCPKIKRRLSPARLRTGARKRGTRCCGRWPPRDR